MGRGYLNVRATGGAVKPLARSNFARLLPEGRKNVGEGVGELSEALSYGKRGFLDKPSEHSSSGVIGKNEALEGVDASLLLSSRRRK